MPKKIMICTTPRGDYLGPRQGKKYAFVKVVHGVFESCPYVVVSDLETGEEMSCHFYRFFNDKEFLNNNYEKLKTIISWKDA